MAGVTPDSRIGNLSRVALFLSPEWIAQLDDAFRHDLSLAEATQDLTLVIQQEVSHSPEPVTSWHVDIDHGSVRAVAGAAPHADVVFRQDHSTAIALGRGELSAQTAFMIGKLQVSGDVALLMELPRPLRLRGRRLFTPRCRADTEY